MSFHMHCYAHFRLHINRWRQYPTFIRVMPCSCAILFSRQCHCRPLNLSQSPRGHVITQLIKFHNNKYNWSKMQRSAHLFVSKSQTINFKKKKCLKQSAGEGRSIFPLPNPAASMIYPWIFCPFRILALRTLNILQEFPAELASPSSTTHGMTRARRRLPLDFLFQIRD